jgi:hypothetical protein
MRLDGERVMMSVLWRFGNSDIPIVASFSLVGML